MINASCLEPPKRGEDAEEEDQVGPGRGTACGQAARGGGGRGQIHPAGRYLAPRMRTFVDLAGRASPGRRERRAAENPCK